MKKQDTSDEVANIVYLSIGSNLGNKILNIEKTKYFLLSQNIKILYCSSFYETPSWPNPKFPRFLNIVSKINTTLDPKDLFLLIKSIEKKIGRKKSAKNYPRLCDIDIIDFNNKNLNFSSKDQKIIIPHPRMHNRNFVLIPMYQINKNWIHPKKSEKITDLLSKLSFNSIRSIKVI